MTILSVKLYDNKNTLLWDFFNKDHYNFFTRKTSKEFVMFASNEIIKKYNENLMIVEYNNHYVYVHSYHNQKAVVITNKALTKRIVLSLMLELFNKGALTKETILSYDKPDKIEKIQKQLEETTLSLHQTIESVLERGEKIEDLIQKSGDLSNNSKAFYYESKKLNRCCSLL